MFADVLFLFLTLAAAQPFEDDDCGEESERSFHEVAADKESTLVIEGQRASFHEKHVGVCPLVLVLMTTA